MINKRIGHSSWAFSADERKTAALVERRQRERTRITTTLQRTHEAILEKGRKVNAREKELERQGVTMIGRSSNAGGTPRG
jgi:hypothetical protein